MLETTPSTMFRPGRPPALVSLPATRPTGYQASATSSASAGDEVDTAPAEFLPRVCDPALQPSHRWTGIHHLQWWRHDGPTDLDNGLARCHACHRLIHDVGWHAELDPITAAVTWTSPDRRRTVVTHPRRPF